MLSQFRDWRFGDAPEGLRAPGIVMDRLPTPDIDSTCSEESSLRTAWISRRDRRPKTRAGERADNKTWA